jgi:adenylyltransferase/sulfurtransferase
LSFGFSEEESRRYARNVILPEVGRAGQERWRSARVAVVGAGGIGSAALLYLAAAGVGHLGVIDGDRLELSNLQRQVIHRTTDLGRPKVESARDAIAALNPHCRVETYGIRLDAANIRQMLTGHDLVLDASDNFATRFLVAEACWQEKLLLVSGAANGFQGLLLVQDPKPGNPCYRCLLPEAPATPHLEGILGAVAGLMGCLMATETLKLLLGRGSDLTRRCLSYDGLKTRFHSLARSPKPDCPLCGSSMKK